MAARSTFKLSDDVRDVLARSTVTATTVTLPAQLDRKLYQEVDKALRAAGGKWDRKSKAHTFDRDPREVLGLAVTTGQAVNVRTALQAFYTPAALAERVAKATGIAEHPDVVIGIDGCDIDQVALERATIALADAFKQTKSSSSFTLHQRDFMTVRKRDSIRYDYIVMNPPFRGGAEDIPSGTFEHTDVSTVLVVLRKPPASEDDDA